MQTVLMACCTPVRSMQIALLHLSEPRPSDIVDKPSLLLSETSFILWSSFYLVQLKHQQDLGNYNDCYLVAIDGNRKYPS